MSNFKEIIDYLKFFRRTEDAEEKNKFRAAINVDEDYVYNKILNATIIDENDLIFVEKEAIVQQNGYKFVAGEIIGNLFLINQTSSIKEYYIKKEDDTSSDTTSLYKRIPYEFSNAWVEKEDDLFVEIEIDEASNFYYDYQHATIIEVFLEDVFVFPDYFVYHPNDITISSDSSFSFNFKDEEGYTTDISDRFLRVLFSSNQNVLISETKRIVTFYKSEKPGYVYLLPKIKISLNRYTLDYNYYQRGIPFNKSINNPAITLSFKSIGAMAEFLNQTLFYELNTIDQFINDDESTFSARELFLEDYVQLITSEIAFEGNDKVLEILYYVPVFLFQKIDINLLWSIIDSTLEDRVTNVGLNKEDITIKILEGIALGYEEKYNNKNIFLAELINRKTKNKEQFIKRLFYRIDGENYKNLLSFLWDIWKKSTYAELASEKNHLINFTDKNPLLLDYRSKKSLGLHVDNAVINWDKNDEIDVTLTVGTGVFETNTEDNGQGGVTIETTEIKETHEYSYHPFAPIVIINADNPTFIYKDPEQEENNFTKLPAFLLHTHKKKAFWENIMTVGEYTVDVITTLSGVGNILKFGRLYKVLQAGKKLISGSRTFTKTVTGVKGVAGVAEISSGSVNFLLKLTGVNDTDLGREISKYLFYFEIAALSGELSLALYKKIQSSAGKILAKEKVLRESVENADEVKQVDKLIEELKRVAGISSKKQLRLWKTNVKEGKFNCANCAMAVDRTLGGNPASALPWTYRKVINNGKVVNKITYNEGTALDILEKEYDKMFIKNMSPDKIRQMLKPGQRGIVYGYINGRDMGHVFNVVNENGVIKFLDGQKAVKSTTDTQKADLIYDIYEFLPTNF